MQDVGQEPKDKESGSNLIGFGSTEPLRVRPPTLSIMRLPIASLLQCCLK